MMTTTARQSLSRILSHQSTDDDTDNVKAALDKLQHYESLAEPESALIALRQSQVLMEFINAQVKPVRDAWLDYLKQGHAL